MARTPWWNQGLKFACQGSGKCCVSREGYGFVYLTATDQKRLAKHFGLSLKAFKQRYCDSTDGFLHLKEFAAQPHCQFLKDKRCTVYDARPTQCRTWPFWPENMSPKAWSIEVASFCPGVGKGPLISAEEIRAKLSENEEPMQISNRSAQSDAAI